MSDHDLLDHASLHLRVAGGLDEADREHLTQEQIVLIEQVDDQVTSWLLEAPERQQQFVAQPTEALTAALGQEPSPQLQELVSGTREQEDTLHRVTEVARWGEPEPQPLSPAALKAPGADNDVTFMLSLEALAKAFQSAIRQPLQEALPTRVWQSLPDVPVSLHIEPESSRPDLRLIKERVYLVMSFRGALKVDVHGHELGLEEIVMTVPLAVEASPGRLAVRPEADDAAFGTPPPEDDDGDGDDEPTVASLIDDGTVEDIADGAVDVFPGLGDAVDTLPAEVAELLTADTLEEVREAVMSWLTHRLLAQNEPLLALLTDLAPHELVCDRLELTDLQAGFLPGDVPALAIGMGYGEDVELPDQSLVEDGYDSWIELSNRLLREVVCCLVPEAFDGLSEEPDHRTDSSCRWEEQPFHDREGQRWEAEHVTVSCTDSLVLGARTTTTKPGVRITATVRLTFELVKDDDGVRFKLHPEIDVDVSLKWWVRITIAAVVGVIVALVLSAFGLTGELAIAGGAAAGVLVALVVEGLVKLIKDEDPPDVLEELKDPLRFIPRQVTELLGDPEAMTSHWDDLELLGSMIPPSGEPADELVTVVDLTGKPELEAREILGKHGFAIPAIERRHGEADEGTVIDQDPRPGEKVPMGAKLTLTVSKGKRVVGRPVPVPDVVGKQSVEAKRVLQDKGFTAEPTPVDSQQPHLRVVRQSPTAGTTQPRGSTVTVFVSRGPDRGDEDGGRRPPQPL